YAHAFAEHYPGGRFVLPAESATDFRTLVVGQLLGPLGIELNDDEKRSIDLAFPRVWNTLKGRGRPLLVLAKLDQPDALGAGGRRRAPARWGARRRTMW